MFSEWLWSKKKLWTTYKETVEEENNYFSFWDCLRDLKDLNDEQTVARANKLYDDFIKKVATPVQASNIVVHGQGDYRAFIFSGAV